MIQKITITHEESENVYRLFFTYSSYVNMLQYLAKANVTGDVYDKKWNEAIKLNIELEEAKRKIERKYKPLGSWENFEFDFENEQVIFTSNEL